MDKSLGRSNALKFFSWFTAAIFIFGLLTNLIGEVDADKEKAGKLVNILKVNNVTCEDAAIEILNMNVREMEPCLEMPGLQTPKERKGRGLCVTKCVMQRSGVLTDDGKLNHEIIPLLQELKVEQQLEELRVGVITTLSECEKEHAGELKNDEKSCQSYGPMVRCLGLMAALCESVQEALKHL